MLEVANGAKVETKAIFVKSFSQGKSTFRRMPFNIETRTYPTKAKGGRQTYLAFAYGRPSDRALAWDDQGGEKYDAVEYYDVYPATWPKIGNVAG